MQETERSPNSLSLDFVEAALRRLSARPCRRAGGLARLLRLPVGRQWPCPRRAEFPPGQHFQPVRTGLPSVSEPARGCRGRPYPAPSRPADPQLPCPRTHHRPHRSAGSAATRTAGAATAVLLLHAGTARPPDSGPHSRQQHADDRPQDHRAHAQYVLPFNRHAIHAYRRSVRPQLGCRNAWRTSKTGSNWLAMNRSAS